MAYSTGQPYLLLVSVDVLNHSLGMMIDEGQTSKIRSHNIIGETSERPLLNLGNRRVDFGGD